MHGEEKGNLSVMKGVSIKMGGVELTQRLLELVGAWGASSKRDGAMRTERKKKVV